MTIKTNHHEGLIRKVRAAGEGLIRNAESIVGTEKYLVKISLSIDLTCDDEIPTIDISRSFVPDRIMESEEKR